jgi:hypothetical protein
MVYSLCGEEWISDEMAEDIEIIVKEVKVKTV